METPILPLPLVEAILAFAPLTSPRATTYLALARVLLPSQAPLAYAAIFARANSLPFDSVVKKDLEQESSGAFLVSNDAFLGLDSRKAPHVGQAVKVFGQVERYLAQRPPTQALANLVRHCCVFGDWSVVDRVCIDDETRQFLHHDVLAAASQVGNVAIARALCPAKGPATCQNLGEYLWIAARHGQTAIVAHLVEHHIQRMGATDTFQAIQLACIGGHIAVLDLLHDYAGPFLSDLTWRYAAEYNHVHVLDWLKDRRVPQPMDDGFGWADWASKNGHLGVLDWFYDNSDRTHYTPAAVEWASEEGRLNVIEWWLSKTDLVFKFSPGAMWQAHKRGHAHVARFWDQYEPYAILVSTEVALTDEQVRLVPRDAATLASFGRLDLMLRFGLAPSIVPPIYVSTRELILAIENAALFGHVHILEHLTNPKNNTAQRSVSNAGGMFISAALPGDRVDVVQWLVKRFPHADESFDWSSPLVELVQLEARCVLEWIFRTRRCNPPVSVDVVRAACRVGDVAMLNLLLTKGLDVDALKVDDLPLIEASRQGHVQVLHWWVRKRLPIAKSTRPVDYASRSGHRIVLDWWLNDSESPFWWSEAAILWAVERKHLKIAQWWVDSQLVKDSGLQLQLQGVLLPTATSVRLVNLKDGYEDM